MKRGWIVSPNYRITKEVLRPQFLDFLIDKGVLRSGNYRYDLSQQILFFDFTGKRWEVWYKSEASGRQHFVGTDVDWIWFFRHPGSHRLFQECKARLIYRKGDYIISEKLPEAFLTKVML